MIEYKNGDLLMADAEALVNAVNCVGVMGKGIALQFKQAYPENFNRYKMACKANQVQIGKMFITDKSPRYLINFPTKQHWRDRSRLDDIRLGLKALVDDISRLKIQSVAIPALGCGNGGLSWNDVLPLIIEAFSEFPDVRVLIYAPKVNQIDGE